MITNIGGDRVWSEDNVRGSLLTRRLSIDMNDWLESFESENTSKKIRYGRIMQGQLIQVSEAKLLDK